MLRPLSVFPAFSHHLTFCALLLTKSSTSAALSSVRAFAPTVPSAPGCPYPAAFVVLCVSAQMSPPQRSFPTTIFKVDTLCYPPSPILSFLASAVICDYVSWLVYHCFHPQDSKANEGRDHIYFLNRIIQYFEKYFNICHFSCIISA